MGLREYVLLMKNVPTLSGFARRKCAKVTFCSEYCQEVRQRMSRELPTWSILNLVIGSDTGCPEFQTNLISIC